MISNVRILRKKLQKHFWDVWGLWAIIIFGTILNWERARQMHAEFGWFF